MLDGLVPRQSRLGRSISGDEASWSMVRAYSDSSGRSGDEITVAASPSPSFVQDRNSEVATYRCLYDACVCDIGLVHFSSVIGNKL